MNSPFGAGLPFGAGYSVPWLEGVLYNRLLPDHRLETCGRRRRDVTVRHYAIRITSRMTALIAVADLIVLPVGAAIRGRPMDGRVAFAWGTAQLVFIAAGTFVFPFLWDAMVRALKGESSGRDRYRPALVAGLSSLVVVVLMLAFVLIVTALAPHGQVFRRSDWLVILPLALIAPVSLFLGARDTISWRLRRDGWNLREMPS